MKFFARFRSNLSRWYTNQNKLYEILPAVCIPPTGDVAESKLSFHRFGLITIAVVLIPKDLELHAVYANIAITFVINDTCTGILSRDSCKLCPFGKGNRLAASVKEIFKHIPD